MGRYQNANLGEPHYCYVVGMLENQAQVPDKLKKANFYLNTN